jgi:phospholipid-binding lipoprotein MlaA
MVLLGSVLLFPSTLLADDGLAGGENFSIVNEMPDLLDDAYDDVEEYDSVSEQVYDPLEPLNRVTFEFNDKLYFWVFKPVKTGYSYVVPEDFRLVIGNFFYNLRAPVRLVNNVLQGKFEDAGIVFSRFMINSTIGVFGFGDAAAEAFDMMPREADFGQTLGVYGLGDGLYICWPVFGPSNVRDSIGLAVDFYIHPLTYIDIDTATTLGTFGTDYVNRLSITPDVYEEMKRISLDPYIATRQAYIDYRQNIIKNYTK